MFENAEEAQIRQRLADTLRYVVSQRLAPKQGGGRVLLTEIMGSNLRVREAIALVKTRTGAFTTSSRRITHSAGRPSTSPSCAPTRLNMISEEIALLYSTRKGKLPRSIDGIKNSAAC